MLKSILKFVRTITILIVLGTIVSCENNKNAKAQPNLFVEVVNENDKPKDFAYSITKSLDSTEVVGGRVLGLAALTLPANQSYDIVITVGGYLETKKNVKWPDSTAKTIRFEFNDEESEFVLDADENTPIDQIDEDGVTDAEKEKEANKGIPGGWVEGKFYNANNVSCTYAGKSLVFVNQGSEILNLQTGKFSEGVIVLPGKSLSVAVSNRGGFFRAFISTGSGNSDARGRSISFVSLDELYKGWWFAAGCEDGSKPATNCNNGDGLTDYGSSCKTLGEDY